MLPPGVAVDMNPDALSTSSAPGAQVGGGHVQDQVSVPFEEPSQPVADEAEAAVHSESSAGTSSQTLASSDALLAERARLTLESLCPDPAVRELLPAAARHRPWFVALLHELRRQWAFPAARS